MKITALTMTSMLLLAACNSSIDSSSSPGPVNLKINLVDAPIDEVKNVFVNIESFELMVDKGGKKENLIFGKEMGQLDLLTLRDGVYLPVTELSLPANTKIKQIRMMLKTDNHLYYNDDTRCDLATPSAQKSGTKILVKDELILEPGSDYKMTIDFDALKSIVITGTGDCILKPVLKLKSLMKSPAEEGGEEPVEEPGVPAVDDGSDDGAEMIDPNDQPVSDPELDML
jgi:hypothetical protein